MEFASFIDIVWIPIILVPLILLILKKNAIPFSSKIGVILTHIIIVSAISLALMNPQVLSEVPASQAGTLTILLDNSTSMHPYQIPIEQIKESLLVPISVQTIAQGNESPLVSRIAGSLYPQGQFLLITDGQATDKDDFLSVVDTAISLNATLHTFDLNDGFTDAGVIVSGPQKTLASAQNTYTVQVTGNDLLPGTLRVLVDGKKVLETQELNQPHQFQQTYFGVKQHTIEAYLDVQDTFATNNAYFMTTRVVPKPSMLYIGENSRLKTFLSEVFTVDQKQSVPNDLEPYNAIVLSNVHSSRIDAQKIETFVADGNGLAVLGGTQAYDFGNYDQSDLAPLLPTKNGISGPKDRATIVIVIDISPSTTSFFSQESGTTVSEIQKALAYDMVESLGNENLVGIVAFNDKAYLVSDLVVLGQGRAELLDKIARLEHFGGTRLNVGLRAALELLDDQQGSKSVVFISDGQATGGDNDGQKTRDAVLTMAKKGMKIFAVGVGPNTQEGVMRQMAIDTGGLFLQPDETDRLKIEFGEATSASSQNLFSFTIVDDNHLITQDLSNPTTRLNNINKVVPKPGARPLVTSSEGDAALVTWNYGLGRVSAWTAFYGNDALNNFLSTDSLLFTRMFTWVAGDPERKKPSTLSIEDTTVHTPATVHAYASTLQELADKLKTTPDELKNTLKIQKIGEKDFTGSITPISTGIQSVFTATYAANYPDEFSKIGESPVVSRLSAATNGKHLKLEDLNTFSVEIQSSEKTTFQLKSIAWLFILLAIVFLLIDILIRRRSVIKRA